MSPPNLTLNAPIEQHSLGRPMFEKVLEPGKNWNENLLYEHASQFLDEIIKKGNPMKIKQDIFVWVCIINHKVMLNMDIMYEEALEFYEMTMQSIKLMVSPKILHNCSRLQDTRNYRKSRIEKYKAILKPQQEELSEENFHIVTAAYYDAFMVAGGLSVPKGIHNALAVIYSSNSPKDQNLEINEENLLAFVLEVLRFYPLVTG